MEESGYVARRNYKSDTITCGRGSDFVKVELTIRWYNRRLFGVNVLPEILKINNNEEHIVVCESYLGQESIFCWNYNGMKLTGYVENT